MYMYINQLIVGIQLCYTVTSIRELFFFSLRSVFPPFFFVYLHCVFFSFSRRISVGEVAPVARWKISVETAVDRRRFLVSFFVCSSLLYLALISRNICYTRRRTTSIGWHIKRKQHLDQSRRDNSYVQTLKRGEEYDVLSCIIGGERSRHKGLKIISLRVWKSRSSPSNKKDPRKSIPPPVYEKTWRRRWNTGDINFGTDIIFAASLALVRSECVLPLSFLSSSISAMFACRWTFFFLPHFFLETMTLPLIPIYRQLSRRGKKNDTKWIYTNIHLSIQKLSIFVFPFFPFRSLI